MTPALQITGLRKSFGAAEIIRGVDLDVVSGERHALIGPNGAGKSTLFDLITGRARPTAGRVRLNGAEITALPSHQIARLGLSRSFQITNLFPTLSVFENIRCARLWRHGVGHGVLTLVDRRRDLTAAAVAVLDQIGMTRRAETLVSALSYAEQRTLEIGMVLAAGAEVILLDEPTAGMSRSEANQMTSLIREVTKGKTLLMVEHDMNVVFDLADRVSVLVYGEIIATGAPTEVRANPLVRQAYLGGDTARVG